MLQVLKSLLILPFLLSLCMTAKGVAPGFYVWQRKHTPELLKAVKDFASANSNEMLFLAAEIENNGKIITVTPPDLPASRMTAVVRIHIKNISTPPVQLAGIIVRSVKPWLNAGCSKLQIDLDAPESKLRYYADLISSLRRQLPQGTLISATVLPCHLRHTKTFALLAAGCNYFVLQIHGAVRTPEGKISLMDLNTALAAVTTARRYGRIFKVAIPCYAHRSKSGLAAPVWQDVVRVVKKCNDLQIPILIFRFGHQADGYALDLANALLLAGGALPYRQITAKLKPGKDGEFFLEAANRGFFSKNVILQCRFPKDVVIEDFDTIGNCLPLVPGSPDKLFLRLMPPGSSSRIMWLRGRNLNETTNIEIKIISHPAKKGNHIQ